MKMMAILMASAATAFMSETEKVINASPAQGKGSGPVRVSQADFDADQEKPEGERQWKAYSGDKEPEQSGAGREIGDAAPIAAPSAPDFSRDESTTATPTPVDEKKKAAAPKTSSPNQRLVKKEGKKYFVVDGKGEKITDLEAVDKDGYDTEAAAWDVVMKLPH